jgi:hypothetical protein
MSRRRLMRRQISADRHRCHRQYHHRFD